ncbi:hypothetical protein F4703DRAFT_1825992 [Phycomyces blakesleeanus]
MLISVTQLQVLDCFLNVPVQRPYVVITLGEQKYYTSVSEYEQGRWHETFELSVSFHAQLFGTIQLDLFDSYMLLPDRHIGRTEIRLRLLEGMPETFTSYYEIWDKKLSTGASSSVGQRKTLTANVGAIQVKIAYVYQSEQTQLSDGSEQKNNNGTSADSKDEPLVLRELRKTDTPVGSSNLLTEEQLATEFQRHLKFQRERKTAGIKFCKYEEGRDTHLGETLDYPDESESDSDSEDSNSLMRPLALGRIKSSSLQSQDSNLSKEDAKNATNKESTVHKVSSWFRFNKPSSSLSTASTVAVPDPSNTKPSNSKKAAFNNNELESVILSDDQENIKAYPLLETIGSWTVNKETNQVLRTIAKLLASFGQGFELTNLQVLTGFTVLEKFYGELPRERTWDLVEDLSEIELASHFWKFSVASYGWKGLNFIGKGNGYLSDAIRNHSDALSIIEFLSIPKEDLLAYEFRTAEAFRPSYFITRDRTTNSIVLVIRGTMSVFDTMTDLVCEYEPWRGGLIHKGMKSSAMWFFRNVAPQLIAYSNEHSTSALYIVGHSLGAATAAILTIMLIDYLDEFRKGTDVDFSLKCFGYAPACGLSLNLSEKYKDYIQSFVFADDVVSKLSYGSMMDVKELIIASAEAAKTLGVGQVLWVGKMEGEKWKTAYERIAECRQRCLDSMANPRLYVAGQVYQFWLDPTPSNETRIVIERTDAERVSREIIVRRSIVLDHLPTNFDIAFKRAREALMMEGSSHTEPSHSLRPEGILDPTEEEKAHSHVFPLSHSSSKETGAVLEGEKRTAASNAIWDAVANLGLKGTSKPSRNSGPLINRDEI